MTPANEVEEAERQEARQQQKRLIEELEAAALQEGWEQQAHLIEPPTPNAPPTPTPKP